MSDYVEVHACRRCGAQPKVSGSDVASSISCECHGLMFLHSQEGMDMAQTVKAWNSMMGEYGSSWSV